MKTPIEKEKDAISRITSIEQLEADGNTAVWVCRLEVLSHNEALVLLGAYRHKALA